MKKAHLTAASDAADHYEYEVCSDRYVAVAVAVAVPDPLVGC